MSKRFLVPIEEDDYGEMTFKIPDTIVEELGWGGGEILDRITPNVSRYRGHYVCDH